MFPDDNGARRHDAALKEPEQCRGDIKHYKPVEWHKKQQCDALQDRVGQQGMQAAYIVESQITPETRQLTMPHASIRDNIAAPRAAAKPRSPLAQTATAIPRRRTNQSDASARSGAKAGALPSMPMNIPCAMTNSQLLPPMPDASSVSKRCARVPEDSFITWIAGMDNENA